MKKLIIALLFAATSLLLIGCNTMNGVGEDLSAGGKDLSKASKAA